jgi:hypothetical protein
MSIVQAIVRQVSKNMAAVLCLTGVLLVPLIQIWSGPSWLYTPRGIDAWVYHGFFLHLHQHLQEFGNTYYSTRLAWIFPGYFVHAHLSPLAANIVLRLYLYLMSVLSVFYLIRRSYGLRCALVSCLALACYPEFLMSIGWDYVDGAGIAYILLCLEEMDAAAREFSRDRTFAFFIRGMATGAAFSAAVHSNLFVVAAVPVVLVAATGRMGRKILHLIPPASCGAAGLTILLGVINRYLGGAFLFFLPSVRFASQNAGTTNQWYVPVSTWILKATWLVLPAAISVIGLVWIARAAIRDKPASKSRIADIACAPLIVSVFVLCNLLGMPVLQFDYYTSYMLPFLVLGSAAMVGDRMETWKIREVVLLCCYLGLIALLVGSNTPIWEWLPSFREEVRQALIPVPAAKLFGVLVVSGLSTEFIKRRLYASIVLLCGLATTAMTLGLMTLPADATESRIRFLTIDATSRELGNLSAGAKLWFWHSSEAETAMEFESISSTYLWGYRLLGTELPKVNSVLAERGDMIALMTDDQASLDQARISLTKLGVKVSERRHWAFPEGHTTILVSILSVLSKEFPEMRLPGQPSAVQLPQQRKTLIEDSSGELVKTVERNIYGKAKTPAAGSTQAGAFPASSSQDHFATRYVVLKNTTSNPIRGLQVQFAKNAMHTQFGALRMIVQDQRARTLYDSGTFYNGDRTVQIPMDDMVEKVRFTFLPNEEGYIVLPDKLHVDALVD